MTSSTQFTGRPVSPSRSSSTTTFSPTTARTSTTSLTLTNNNNLTFSAPPRAGTGSTTSSSVTAHSTNRARTFNPDPSAPRSRSHTGSSRISREEKMSARQTDLLRNKGTYTEAGRHSSAWLFGGWSLRGSVKDAWRAVKR